LPTQVKGIAGARGVCIGAGHVAAADLGNMRSYAVRADGTFWRSGFGDYRVKGILAKNLNVPTLLDLR
jgi:hypothetical protein